VTIDSSVFVVAYGHLVIVV